VTLTGLAAPAAGLPRRVLTWHRLLWLFFLIQQVLVHVLRGGETGAEVDGGADRCLQLLGGFVAAVVVVKAKEDLAAVVLEEANGGGDVDNTVQGQVVVIYASAESGETQHIEETFEHYDGGTVECKVGGDGLGGRSALIAAVPQLIAAFVVLVGERVEIAAVVAYLEVVVSFLKVLLGDVEIDAPLVQVGEEAGRLQGHNGEAGEGIIFFLSLALARTVCPGKRKRSWLELLKFGAYTPEVGGAQAAHHHVYDVTVLAGGQVVPALTVWRDREGWVCILAPGAPGEVAVGHLFHGGVEVVEARVSFLYLLNIHLSLQIAITLFC